MAPSNDPPRATRLPDSAQHWREYLMEAGELGLFMVSACTFAAILFHPASPAHPLAIDPLRGRMLMGLAMGLTAIAIVHSPWGKQSGAHFNPAVTLTFWRLGKVRTRDAIGYVIGQFAGGVAGVVVATLFLGDLVMHPAVDYVVTVPGDVGVAAAFGAEVAISFVLMLTVLAVSNTDRLARFTSVFAGALVATWITVEAPVSGMSMNPARTFGSAVPAGVWTALWIYFTAPPLGMLLAAEVYVRVASERRVYCAKLHHRNARRCIFRCGYREQATSMTRELDIAPSELPPAPVTSPARRHHILVRGTHPEAHPWRTTIATT